MIVETFRAAIRVTDADLLDLSSDYLSTTLAEAARLHDARPMSPWRVDRREPQDDGSVAVIFACEAVRVATKTNPA